MNAAPKPTRKRSRGRPPKLTPELRERVCAAISKGAFVTQACKLAGINLLTLERWQKWGADGREPYASFLTAYEQADAKGEQALIEIVRAAAPQDWRAAMQLLKSRYPHRWSEHAARLAVLGDERNQIASGLVIHIHTGDWQGKTTVSTIQVSTGGDERPAIEVTAQHIEDHRSAREQQRDASNTRTAEPAPPIKPRDPDPDPTLN